MAKRLVKTHGVSGYRAGCRCFTCTMAESERKRSYRATGTGSKSDGANVGRNRQNRADIGNVTPIRPIGAGEPRTAATAARGQESTRQAASQPAIGRNTQAVIDECSRSPLADKRPGLVAAAQTLARILDDELFKALWPNTSRQLQSVLRELAAGPAKKSKGRLYAVKQLTSGKAAGND
jgi:hypothetical protein